MELLTPAERELVALGASLASNCAPCVAYHIAAARKAGLHAGQIADAIEIADQVRQVPARAALDAALRALPDAVPDVENSDHTAAPCCP